MKKWSSVQDNSATIAEWKKSIPNRI